VAGLYRPQVLRQVDEAFAEQPIVLTLGGTIRELLQEVGPKPNHLYSLDAMGQPLAIGLGLALGLADRSTIEKVVVVEGDGSLLMGFSALTTAGALDATRLVLLVLDNGAYLATGGQPTLASRVDFAGAARACGWAGGRDVAPTEAALAEALAWSRATRGPLLLRVPVDTAQPPTGYFLEDPVVLGHRFQAWLDERR
jgi:thiamine pyrophosphate-dependent acetolactate synthase large subunit-like protein